MFEADAAPPQSDGIGEVLGNLDRATRDFTRRLEELATLGATSARHNGTRPPDAEAQRYLEDARRRADAMVESIVADRLRQISDLSDTIVGRAEALTVRMADAERIRSQFDSLVVALADAAERLAATRPPVTQRLP
jgi:hypothetical protein